MTGKADGIELLQVRAQHGRRHNAFARLHPVVVALDGVDLTVVRHIAIGVGQGPLGEGIGREALVHQTQGRHATLVLQILEIHTHLVSQQQALVDHSAAGHAGHVILFAVLEVQGLDMGAGSLADHIQLALQRVLHDDVVTATNKHLAQDRFLGAHGGRHRHVTVHRNVAPAQQHLAFGLDGAFHFLLAGQAGCVFLGQEDHAHAVFAGGRQGHALRCHLFAVERVGQLDQDTGAIAHQRVSTDGTPVVQVFKNLERILDNGMAFFAPNMGHKTNATGVVLLFCGIQTVFG